MDLAEHDRLLATLRTDPAKPVLDGPIVAARYERATPRILWVLREHHGPNGWDYRDFVATDPSLFRYKRWKQTLGPVAMVSHGVLRGCIPWGEWAENPSKLTDSLREIALININKEGGDTQVNWDRFLVRAAKYREVVAKQVLYLDPHVVICAGTYGIVRSALSLLQPHSEPVPASSVVSHGRVYVDAYHPNQRTVTHRAYYEAIRNDVQRLRPLVGSS